MNLIKLAEMDVTRNVFHIKYNGSVATAFLFYHRERQFLVTAAHVLTGMKKNDVDVIEIFRYKKWCKFIIEVANIGDENDSHTDLAVLVIHDIKNEISHSKFHFRESLKSHEISDIKDVYFLGFPLGLSSRAPNLFDLDIINDGLPMPFLKNGIISNFGHLDKSPNLFYLNAIINYGFSGGPAFFFDDKEGIILLGVMTEFLKDDVPGHSGIGGGILIKKVVDLINAIYFKEGDSVREKTKNAPIMSILSIDESSGTAECVWYKNREMQMDSFLLANLEEC